MKTSRTLALSILLSGGLAFQAHCQSVTLGDATFDAASNQPPAESFSSLRLEVVQILAGYGDYAGFLKNRKYSVSESVAGVSAVKCTTAGASEVPDAADLIIAATGARVTTSDACWLAFDTSGNLRVLKVSYGGAPTYEVSETETPPILMPANPTEGQTWDVLGKTITVVALNASAGGRDNLLKLKVEASAGDAGEGAPPATEDAEFEYKYYMAGKGLVAIEASASDAEGGSGWNLSE